MDTQIGLCSTFQKLTIKISTILLRPKSTKSLDEVDPELLKTYEKLGIPLHERAALAGVAVDAVFDSVRRPPSEKN